MPTGGKLKKKKKTEILTNDSQLRGGGRGPGLAVVDPTLEDAPVLPAHRPQPQEGHASTAVDGLVVELEGRAAFEEGVVGPVLRLRRATAVVVTRTEEKRIV